MFEKWLQRDERQMLLMRAMMERLRVDTTSAVQPCWGGSFMAAIRACRSCRETEACARWVADPASAAAKPEFCPNMEFFLQHQQAPEQAEPSSCCAKAKWPT